MSSHNRKNKRGQRGSVEEEVSVAKKSNMADSKEEETETNLEEIRDAGRNTEYHLSASSQEPES